MHGILSMGRSHYLGTPPFRASTTRKSSCRPVSTSSRPHNPFGTSVGRSRVRERDTNGHVPPGLERAALAMWAMPVHASSMAESTADDQSVKHNNAFPLILLLIVCSAAGGRSPNSTLAHDDCLFALPKAKNLQQSCEAVRA